MGKNKNQFKIGDLISGTNCYDKRVNGEIVGFAEKINLPLVSSELSPTTVVWNAVLMPKQALKPTDIPERDNRLIADDSQMTATLWSMLESFKHEATRAREYLRLTGATCTPDRVHEILHLRTSRATLGRKMREAAQRGELTRSYYVNERGTKICQYSFNPNYKESI